MEANGILRPVKESYALHEFVQITRTSYLYSGFTFMVRDHEILMPEDADDTTRNS
jgi:hypothetical protein